MDSFGGLSMGLGNIYLMSQAQTRSISAENPDGAKGGGAKAKPEPGSPASELGRGWKVRPWPNVKYQPLTDDIASTAYWYQAEPHGKFPKLPTRPERFPR